MTDQDFPQTTRASYRLRKALADQQARRAAEHAAAPEPKPIHWACGSFNLGTGRCVYCGLTVLDDRGRMLPQFRGSPLVPCMVQRPTDEDRAHGAHRPKGAA